MDNIINDASEFPGGVRVLVLPGGLRAGDRVQAGDGTDAASSVILNLPGSARHHQRRKGREFLERSRVDTSRRPSRPRSATASSAQMPRWKYKEIIFAVLHVQEMQSERRNEDGSPVGPPDYEYTLDVSYHPLDYIELIVWFAFEEKVFLIIFFHCGFSHYLNFGHSVDFCQLTTMLENPPRVRIWSTLLLDCGAAVPGRASRRPIT